MNVALLGNTTMFVVIAFNCLWYYIKYVVSQNGYEMHWFSGHLNDIANLHRLCGQEQDVIKKRNYRILLFAFYTTLLLCIIVFKATVDAFYLQ